MLGYFRVQQHNNTLIFFKKYYFSSISSIQYKIREHHQGEKKNREKSKIKKPKRKSNFSKSTCLSLLISVPWLQIILEPRVFKDSYTDKSSLDLLFYYLSQYCQKGNISYDLFFIYSRKENIWNVIKYLYIQIYFQIMVYKMGNTIFI